MAISVEFWYKECPMSTQSRKEKEVWAACEKLHKKGKKLTYKAIGDKLSDMGFCRGSNSDIYRYLSTWRNKKEGITTSSATHQEVAELQDGIWQEANEAMELMKSQFVEQVNHLEAECERLQAASHDFASPLSTPPSHEPGAIEALVGPDSAVMHMIQQSIQQLIKDQEASLLRLFEHHQTQFDQYMSALDHLRNANNLLSNQMASLRATHAAQLQDHNRQAAAAKEQASLERKRRMHLERLLHTEKSSGA